MTDEEKLKFPAGKFIAPETINGAALSPRIEEIKATPALFIDLIGDWSEERLNARTLLGVWSVRQVVHHTADSHMNSFIRFKLALTEDAPHIRPYAEGQWALLPDSCGDTPVQLSLGLLENLHARWGILLDSLSDEDLKRTYHHPEEKRDYRLGEAIAMYAWHGLHHLGHIRALAEKQGW